MNPIRGYFSRVWQILTEPTAFFKNMPTTGGVSGPLAFALITHWLGSAVGFFWHALIGGAIGEHFDALMRMAGDVAEVDNPGRNAQMMEMAERMKHWVWGAGSVIADPFLTLGQILFVSFMVFLGARIFIANRGVTFESALRIVCYGMTPSILTALPLFGSPIAYIYKIVVTVIGAGQVYRVGKGRATLVALFPQVLLMGILLLIFFAISLALMKFFMMAF
jgi:hypothetical protein